MKAGGGGDLGRLSELPAALYAVLDSWNNSHTPLTVNNKPIFYKNLPTSDPHVVKQLWNSGGTVKVSSG